jgi:solute carrier family 25 carnitine/acylcarnitine transporter 20/29
MGLPMSLKHIYLGVGPVLMGVVPIAGLTFATYSTCKRWLNSDTLSAHALAGAMTATMTTFIICPAEQIKVQLQTQRPIQWSSSILFRGFGFTLLRDMVGNAIYFGAIAGWSELGVILKGGLAGMLSWAAIFPLDTLKTRQQSGRIYYRHLYRGLGPTLLRAFPASAGFYGGTHLVSTFFSSG